LTPHYKLLVIDIDGTLIDRYGDVSAQNLEALALARHAGVQVSLSTGRSLRSCLGIIEKLSLGSYHIFFDGALVSGPDLAGEIYTRLISPPVVRQMIDFSRRHGLTLDLYSATHYFAEHETWSTEAHRKFFGIEPTLGDFNQLNERERIIKGGLAITNPEEEAALEAFIKYFAGRLHVSRVKVPTFPDVTFINIVAPGTSKGIALEALAAHLGIPLDEVAAVGDGQNDISLLDTAGLAIAMGNAHEELKKIADHITLSVEEHGLAAAIKKFLV
jgi:Cof subfamily protein (haloacid dehalogenase superfamily)